MLALLGKSFRNCDGVSRRSFLHLGGLTIGGFTLADRLRYESQLKAAERPANRKAVILIYLAGGPSHIDTYDLKPNAPSEFRVHMPVWTASMIAAMRRWNSRGTSMVGESPLVMSETCVQS